MTKQLPPRPNLEQLKNQAKTILRGHRAGQAETLQQIRERHPRWRKSSESEIRAGRFALADAQLVLAREYGFETWTKLKEHVRTRSSAVRGEASVNALREAAGRGDLTEINRLLDAAPHVINEADGPGVRTALHQAVFGRQEAALKLLLERGADPNIRCEGDNAMALHFAAERQLFPVIRLLVEHGADPVGEGDYHELGVMGWATAWDYVRADPEIVGYLLAHGGRHNIFSAVATGDTEAIQRLAAQTPADRERRMDLVNQRRMPLHLAVVKKQRDSLLTLLDLGARLESLDEAGFSALDTAALRGENDLAQVLLDRGAKVRLPAAFALQRAEDVERLLAKSPDILKPGNRWENLIVRAAELAPGPVIEALIRAGASVDVRDDPKTAVDSTWGYTPLHAAAFHGNTGAASVLLAHGASVTAREEKYHGTPAGWANHAGRAETRDVILRGPIDIMESIEYGRTERIRAILTEDPDALNRPFSSYTLFPLYAEGWHTPVAFAVIRQQLDVARLLLERGADHTLRSPEGRSLVELAREKGPAELATLLSR